MKHNLLKFLFLAICLGCSTVYGQVKIGDSPSQLTPGALLELESSNKGFILPRLPLTSTTNPAPLQSHVKGMSVYNTVTINDVVSGIYYNDGSKWIRMLDSTDIKPSVYRYTLGSTSGAGAIVKASGTGVTMFVNETTQTVTFSVPKGVEILSIRLWETKTDGTSSYGMSSTSANLKVKFVFADATQGTAYTNTVLPIISTVLHYNTINPSYTSTNTGSINASMQFELVGAPAENSFTVVLPLMNPLSVNNAAWTVLLNF